MLLKEIREKDVMDRLNEAKSIKRKQDEIKSKQAIERLAKAREDVEHAEFLKAQFVRLKMLLIR
jgi:hypothetical protein